MQVNDQVTVKKPQLHGNCSEIRRGVVVAITPERVSVAFPNGFKPEEFPVDQVTMARDSFGDGCNADNLYEKPITKMYRS